MHLLWAPTLDDTCEQYLFRVISNESNEVIDDMSEMSVRTSADNRFSHSWAKWGENSCKGCVEQLAFEDSKLQTVIMPAIT